MHCTNVKVSYLFLALLFFISTLPVNSKVYFIEAQYYQDSTQQRKITLGKAEIISSDKPIARIAVSDPNIADLQILNEKQVFVRAKQLGICTFLLWEKTKIAPTRFDISVWPDIEYLTKQLQKLDKNINVEYIPPLSSVSSGTPQIGGELPSGETTSEAGGGVAGGAQGNLGAAGAATNGASGGGTGSTIAQEKIILTGEVATPEVIAKALQIAGAYVNDQGIRIISQSGGQIIDGLVGSYSLNRNSDSGLAAGGGAAGGGGTQFGAREQISFTNNSHANLTRSVIVTTQNGRVLSFLTVKNPPQISVAIRFYEISRSLTRDLGFNQTIGGSSIQAGNFIGGANVSAPSGGTAAGATTGTAPSFNLGRGARSAILGQTLGAGITGAIFNPASGVGLAIQALQQRGEVKALAEPTLVISNGEPASFLAGGEVPIQRSIVVTGGTAQDISYEPFGIRFIILPTITTGRRIHLQLVPEIRDIDTELSSIVAPAGSTLLRPPAFRTRRTQTQVELESGQAFAISGLLREDNTRNLRKVPGAGDVPILGTLFRSKSFRRGETELLIVVSPKIVTPTEPEKIAELKRTEEVPYNEFNQLPPIKKSLKYSYENLHDERGPVNIKEPLDASKYFPPSSKPPEPEHVESTEDMSLNDLLPKEQIIDINKIEQKAPEIKKVEPVKPAQIKKPVVPQAPKKTIEPPKPKPPQAKIEKPAQEVKKAEPAKPSMAEKEKAPPEVKKTESVKPAMTEKPKAEVKKAEPAKPSMIEKKPSTQKIDIEELPLAPIEFREPTIEERLKEEDPIMKKSENEQTTDNEEIKLAKKIEKDRKAKEKEEARLAKKLEDEKMAKEKEEAKARKKSELEKIAKEKEEARLAKKLEDEKMAKEKEEARLAKKLEDEKIAKEKEEARLLKKAEDEKQAQERAKLKAIKDEELMKKTWEKESERFAKAQESMKLARESKEPKEESSQANDTKVLFKSNRLFRFNKTQNSPRVRDTVSTNY